MNTLGLNMIAGAGDAPDLRRCLESCYAKELFDEIVIVPTTNDEEVIKVADEYNTNKVKKISFCTKEYPIGNFSRARNNALDQSNSDFIMWLDCDDIMWCSGDKNVKDTLMKLKGFVQKENIDVYTIQYIISTKCKSDIPDTVLKRDRIFRRCSEVHWKFPAHEQLTISDIKGKKEAHFSNLFVKHIPSKSYQASLSRNFKILEHELQNVISPDPYLKFVYAKELLVVGSIDKDIIMCEKAITILNEILLDKVKGTSVSSLFGATLLIATYYAYGTDSENEIIDIDNLRKIETYARIALSYTENNAEPYVIIGDVYLAKNDIGKAVKMYKKAMGKVYGEGIGVQQIEYYGELPAMRLMEIALREDELESALWYNKTVVNSNPNNTLAIEFRKDVIKKLSEKYL